MMHRLTRRIFVLFLAVFVTAGMGLSAVQASTMNFKMMNMSSEMKMSSDMDMSGPKDCQDCGKMGDGKAMPGCVAASCMALTALLDTPTEDLNLQLSTIHHLDQTRAPDGAGSAPSPYPPRTTNIG